MRLHRVNTSDREYIMFWASILAWGMSEMKVKGRIADCHMLWAWRGYSYGIAWVAASSSWPYQEGTPPHQVASLPVER